MQTITNLYKYKIFLKKIKFFSAVIFQKLLEFHSITLSAGCFFMRENGSKPIDVFDW